MKPKTSKQQTPSSPLERKLKGITSLEILVNLIIFGLGLVFVTLTVMYLLSSTSWKWEQFKFPKIFLISTVLLGFSSFTIHKTIQYFIKDEFEQFKGAAGLTFLLGTGFLITQVLGWKELQDMGIYIAGKPDGSYMYIISGLHALHLVAGIGMLIHLMFKIYLKLGDPVNRLLYFSDNSNLLKLRMIARYWHFVDLLWVYILLFFLFNHL